jgi:hypothetical protein
MRTNPLRVLLGLWLLMPEIGAQKRGETSRDFLVNPGFVGVRVGVCSLAKTGIKDYCVSVFKRSWCS